MLFFHNENIFELNKKINPDLLYLKGLTSSLLNFTFTKPKSAYNILYEFILIDKKGGEISLNIDLLDLYYDLTTETYYIIFKDKDLTSYNLVCDFYQIKITFTIPGREVWYSNWFILSESFDNNIKISSNSDFDNKLYSKLDLYLYFDKKAITGQPFIEESIQETGEVSKLHENQIYSELYTIKMLGDKYFVKELNKLFLFSSFTATFDEYNYEKILDKIEVTSNYNEEYMLYEITLTFKLHEIIKSCDTIINVTLLPKTNDKNLANDSGDTIIANTSNDNIILNSNNL